MTSSPSLILLAGPSGAGKTTVAPALLQGALGVDKFVNAVDWSFCGCQPTLPRCAAFGIELRLVGTTYPKQRFAGDTTLDREISSSSIGQ